MPGKRTAQPVTLDKGTYPAGLSFCSSPCLSKQSIVVPRFIFNPKSVKNVFGVRSRNLYQNILESIVFYYYFFKKRRCLCMYHFPKRLNQIFPGLLCHSIMNFYSCSISKWWFLFLFFFFWRMEVSAQWGRRTMNPCIQTNLKSARESYRLDTLFLFVLTILKKGGRIIQIQFFCPLYLI